MKTEWNIKPRGQCCAKCGKQFSNKQEFVSELRESADGFTRADFCLDCREKSNDAFSVWQAQFEAPAATKKDDAEKHESSEELFRRLVALDDPANANVIYILAVLLERKRLLVERAVKRREDGVVFRVYERRGSGDTFMILDPQLRLDDLVEVQQQVIEMLG